MRIRKQLVSAVMFLALAGCATIKPVAVYDSSLYAHSYQEVNLTFHWNTVVSDASVDVKGYVKNGIHYPVGDLSVTAVLLDRDHNQLGETAHFFIRPVIAMDGKEAFDIVIPRSRTGTPLTIQYVYRYQTTGSRGSGQVSYSNTFEEHLPGSH